MRIIGICALSLGIFAAPAAPVEAGDRRAPAAVGALIDAALDLQGARIDARLDRRASAALARGDVRRAIALDRRGDRIERRLDRLGDRIERRGAVVRHRSLRGRPGVLARPTRRSDCRQGRTGRERRLDAFERRSDRHRSLPRDRRPGRAERRADRRGDRFDRARSRRIAWR